MVQRFDFCQWSDETAGMQEEEDGEFVEYVDYVEMRNDRDYWYELCLAAGLLDGEEVKQ